MLTFKNVDDMCKELGPWKLPLACKILPVKCRKLMIPMMRRLLKVDRRASDDEVLTRMLELHCIDASSSWDPSLLLWKAACDGVPQFNPTEVLEWCKEYSSTFSIGFPDRACFILGLVFRRRDLMSTVSPTVMDGAGVLPVTTIDALARTTRCGSVISYMAELYNQACEARARPGDVAMTIAFKRRRST